MELGPRSEKIIQRPQDWIEFWKSTGIIWTRAWCSSIWCRGSSSLETTWGNWKPIAYVSRSMIDTEQRYAQIEKEALAITWVCEKLHQYLIGSKFEIESWNRPQTISSPIINKESGRPTTKNPEISLKNDAISILNTTRTRQRFEYSWFFFKITTERDGK